METPTGVNNSYPKWITFASDDAGRHPAFAQLAMAFAHRINEEVLCLETFADRLRLLVLTNVAGLAETVPLPPGWDE